MPGLLGVVLEDRYKSFIIYIVQCISAHPIGEINGEALELQAQMIKGSLLDSEPLANIEGQLIIGCTLEQADDSLPTYCIMHIEHLRFDNSKSECVMTRKHTHP